MHPDMSDQLPRSLSGMDSQSNVIQNLKKYCKETYLTKRGKKEKKLMENVF